MANEYTLVTKGLLGSLLVTEGYAKFIIGTSSKEVLDAEMTVTTAEDYVTGDKADLERGTYLPLTGIWSQSSDITGWVFDRRRVEDRNKNATVHKTFLGGHRHGLKDGTKLEHWQSGTISGLKYYDIAHYDAGDFLTWTPRVVTGAYALYFDERSLYSDYSYSENIDLGQNQLVGGSGIEINSMLLRNDAVHNTLQVSIWHRYSKDYSIYKYRNFEYVPVFTGEIDELTNERKTTETDSQFLVDNFATRKFEYTIRDNRLYLNGNHTLNIGITEPPLNLTVTSPETIEMFWEAKNNGSESGRSLFTEYFPISPTGTRVVSVAGVVLTEWIQVETLDFSGPTDKHYTVDNDLGIIQIGGYQADDLTLAQDTTESDVEIVVFIDDETMSQYPESGIIEIGTEQILYYGKTRNRFIDCVRGYNSTTPVAYTRGELVHDRKHGMGTTDKFYIAYTAVPRVDYEVTDHVLRSANKDSWLDIRPARNVLTNNILQIKSQQKHLAKVVLETDSPSLGGNLYGPVFYGTDVSRLTARALDSSDSPVEDIDLTIEILTGAGRLNGAVQSVSGLTNSLGEIYAFYNAPYSNEDMGQIVSLTEHQGPDTIMTLPDTITAGPGDIWVYQVLKHDKTLGTTGLQRTITEVEAVTPAIGEQVLELDVLLNKNYKGGFVYILGTDAVKYFRNIVDVQDGEDVNGAPVSHITLDFAITDALIIGQPIYLYEPDAKEWNPALLNGVRAILYEWTDMAIHPVTGELGAYTPLHPDQIAGKKLTFNNRNLAIPEPYNDANNLGAYSIITSSEVSLQAYGVDPTSGNIIKSNIIRLQVDLPTFLVSVDTSGALPIPYGWTLVTEEFNLGTGLGGANFLTINPVAELINQFNLTGEI